MLHAWHLLLFILLIWIEWLNLACTVYLEFCINQDARRCRWRALFFLSKDIFPLFCDSLFSFSFSFKPRSTSVCRPEDLNPSPTGSCIVEHLARRRCTSNSENKVTIKCMTVILWWISHLAERSRLNFPFCVDCCSVHINIFLPHNSEWYDYQVQRRLLDWQTLVRAVYSSINRADGFKISQQQMARWGRSKDVENRRA